MQVEQIFLSFLECQQCPSSEFQAAVLSLPGTIEKDDGTLESDGLHYSFRAAELMVDGGEPLEEADAEVYRSIGAQLAALGDQFERDGLFRQEVVESLVNEILNQSLTEDRFDAAVRSLLDKVPAGVEQEKASLVVAMKLTSMVGKNIPNLLQNCFTTATRFIQGNLGAYVQRLTQQR